jgi:integrase
VIPPERKRASAGARELPAKEKREANRTTFTQLAIDRIKPPPAGRVTYWDKTLPGFGLRVAAPRPGSAEGRKTWIAMGRVDGKAVMETIGTLAQIPKVERAREKAREAIGKMRAGAKPLEERRDDRRRREAEAAAAAAAAIEAINGRFEVVARSWLAEGWQRSKQRRRWSTSYADEVKRMLEHDVFPSWSDRPIKSITRKDVDALLDAKAARRERRRKGRENGAEVQANRVLTRLRTLFGWAIAQGHIDADPSAGVAIRGEETERERYLDDDEIGWFWRGTERAGWPFGSIFKIMLLTAQREGEVAGMRWSELDFDRQTWIIPPERTKSDRAHVVHLSELACEVLREAPRMGGDLVFPSRVGTVISSFTKPKERLDVAMVAQKREVTGDPVVEVDAWVLHDLRRTAATVMAEKLKVREEVADKILNHANRRRAGSLAKVYNRADYLDERRAALEALGRYVEGLVRPGSRENVVPLATAPGIGAVKPDLSREFREVLAALASEYGASREDVIAAVRKLAAAGELPSAAPTRRGRRSIDDHDLLEAAARLRLSGAAASDWEAAVEVAKRRPGHSREATEKRLYRAMRQGHWPEMDFYRWFPNAARVEVMPEKPFARVQRALHRIRQNSLIK